jgi:hypothetical protein
MRPPTLFCRAPLPLSQGTGPVCALHKLRYNRANETAAEVHAGYGSGLKEASMRRGQLVSRRSRYAGRPCPSCLLPIERA